jgi:hypothetical protein
VPNLPLEGVFFVKLLSIFDIVNEKISTGWKLCFIRAKLKIAFFWLAFGRAKNRI